MSVLDHDTTPLRRWRDEHHATVDDAAGLSGISPAMWSRLERRVRNPSPEMKLRIAKNLHVPVRNLFPLETEG